MPSEFAALLREPLTVTVAGTRITLPYSPAALWVKALDHPGRIVAVLADREGQEALIDLILEHPEAVAEVGRESLRILEEAGGRKWWESARLLATSVQPEVLGRLVLAGADPYARSVGEWCAAVYALCVKGQDEKGRLRFDFSLSIPPPGYEDEWDDGGGEDPEAVAAALAQMTGKKK